ncbi:hypothetical protein LL06_16000 [Hoeflea sp. BAL378]|nr:hypothetical protein LL06_16000 [Hoeflea sp. BAL378]
MPFRNVADPDQLAVLRRALAEICAALDVPHTDSKRRDELAGRILWYHSNGVDTVEHLKRNVLAEITVRRDK